MPRCMKSKTLALFALVAALSTMTLTKEANADRPSNGKESSGKESSGKECARAYEDAQRSMRETKLRKAREQLDVCSRDACMAAIRKDCLTWLDEVNAAMPSVVLGAKDREGKETFDVTVSLTGSNAGGVAEVLTRKLDVKAIELDPGRFTLRFERAGSSPIEKEVVLRQGQKNKQIEVSWESTPPVVSNEPAIMRIEDASKRRSFFPYVVGGAGVLLVGAGSVFWATSESKRSDLQGSCAPHCSVDQADSIKTQRLVGDVLASVGVVAIGAAVVWIVTDITSAKPHRSGQGASNSAFGAVGTRGWVNGLSF